MQEAMAVCAPRPSRQLMSTVAAVLPRCNCKVAACLPDSGSLSSSHNSSSCPQVDYREKLYAVGRIPSTYNKREGTAKEHELLAVRAPPRCA